MSLRIKYAYSKTRKHFGREPLFQMVPAQMLDSIKTDKTQQKLYALRNPVNREVQATMPQSEHESNTKKLVIHDQGMEHTEGGWPREVHSRNEDQVFRHRRRILHDENYTNAVKNLFPPMKHYLNQNNAIDMYQTYFENMSPREPIEKYNIRVVNTFHESLSRPVSCVAWTNEQIPKLTVSYFNKISFNSESIEELNNNNKILLWDISKHTSPILELEPPFPCWQLACSPVDCEILIAGLENGTVGIFDYRRGTKLVSSSTVYNSHREPITALLYTYSRTNTEFFSGSPDGQCLWWDIRNLSNSLDQLPMSVKLEQKEEPNISNAEGVSSLGFDRALPTKFLCGTESGLVINVNRMGKTHAEKLYCYWNAHKGPVRAVRRSPTTSRIFLTCGDWSVRIWSEEVRTAPIIVTNPYPHEITDVAWAPIRFSSYMAVSADGMFYYWDLLRKYREPIFQLQVSKHSLSKISPHPDGHLVAVGDKQGSVFLLELSENMVGAKPSDKPLLMEIYERETKREHSLDMRLKEIRLKQMSKEETRRNEAGADTEIDTVADDIDQDLEKTTEEYMSIVNNELYSLDMYPPEND